MTDSDGGGRVRVGGLELGLGGGPTSILGFEMERERRTFKVANGKGAEWHGFVCNQGVGRTSLKAAKRPLGGEGLIPIKK